MKPFLEYLSDADRTQWNYSSASSKLQTLGSINCPSREELILRLQSLNTNFEPCVLTILTHGHPEGIVFGSLKANLLSWQELHSLVNHIRTDYPLVLNLTGVCNSNSIAKAMTGNRIDEIWATTSEVNSIHKSILAAEQNDFETFQMNLDDSEAEKFVRIILN